jgi:YD repeat-containing protein
MNCNFGIHIDQQIDMSLRGGGIFFIPSSIASGPQARAPLAPMALGSTSFDTVIVDANGDRINFSDPSPPLVATSRTAHTDVFSSVESLGTTITVTHAGPPGAMRQKGNYKYVFSGDYLQSIEDTFGNKQTYTYGVSPTDPYLTVTDLTSSRQLLFYKGSTGYIESVVAPYLGTSTPAVTTRLTWDSDGHMTSSRVYFQNTTSSPVHEDVFTYSGDELIGVQKDDEVQTSTFVNAQSKDAYGFEVPMLSSTTYGDSGDTTGSDDGYSVQGTFGYAYNNETDVNGAVTGHSTSFTDARYATAKLTSFYTSIYDSTNTGYFKQKDLTLPPFTGAIDPVTSSPSTETKASVVYQPNVNNPTDVELIDPLGKLWKQTLSNSLPLSMEDPLHNTTSFTWGGTSGTDLQTLTDPTNLTWAFEYTATGGRITKFTDPTNNILSTATYNAYGQVATETTPAAVSATGLDETTSYSYDATTGDLTQIEAPDGSKTVVGLVDPVTHSLIPNTSYDPLGDPFSFSIFPDTGDPSTSTSPLSIQFTWNAAQEMTQAILGNGLRLVNTYVAGKKTKVQTLDPSNTVLSEMNYAYDTRGRVYEVSDLAGIVAKYRYDKNSNVTQVIDGRGNSSYAQYGQNNEPTTASSDGSYNTNSLLYDAAGRVRESTDRRGVVYQFSYDDAGRLTGITIPSQTSDNSTYSYDAAGRPLSVVRANGDSVVYAYAHSNKWLTSVTTTVGSRVHTVSYTYYGSGLQATMTSTVTGGHSRSTGYQWDKNGRIVSETTPGFGTTNWIYDFAGRMLAQTTTTPSSGTIGVVYTWGTSGLVGDPSTAPVYLSRITHTANGVETIHWDMTYSLLGQVNTVLGQRANGDSSSDSYTYDSRGRLTGESRSHTVSSVSFTGSSSYTYDLANNLNAGGNGWTYDADNQLTSAPAAGGMPGGSGIAYDASGNMTSLDGKTITYDALGQAVSIAVPGSGGTGTVTLAYDPLGRRFSETEPNGDVTYFDYAGDALIGEQLVTSSGSTYTDIISGLGAMVGGTPQYQQFDPGGNLDSTVSSSGAVTGYMQRRVNAMGAATEGPGASAQLIGAGNTPAAGARVSPTTGMISSQRNGGRSSYSGGIGGLLDDPENGSTEGGLKGFRDNFGNGGRDLLNSPPWQPGSPGRRFTSFAAGFIPGVGTAYNAYVAATGWDPIAGECVPLGGRILAGLGSLGDALGALGHLPSSGMRPRSNCFVAGTPVRMADGTTKPIEEIKAGDFVASKDQLDNDDNEKEGKLSGVVAGKVVRTFVHYDVPTLIITFNNGEEVTTTKSHRFFVEGKGWIEAGQLAIGNSIVTRAGPRTKITRITSGPNSTVYNFEVEKTHTYFVGETDGGLWVHNDCLSLGITGHGTAPFGEFRCPDGVKITMPVPDVGVRNGSEISIKLANGTLTDGEIAAHNGLITYHPGDMVPNYYIGHYDDPKLGTLNFFNGVGSTGGWLGDIVSEMKRDFSIGHIFGNFCTPLKGTKPSKQLLNDKLFNMNW